ncbi:tRNA lysidine(34) synthetase TilS [Azorhizobium sp. AG788]|uniref:tRNA lysidine(34) synthetase TilS n=1 Tax=Azorhizobium sp. AG788 TaxID=2183897 RepID=UPI00313876AE
MPAAERAGREPIDAPELEGLFSSFLSYDRILIGVSGGPDSTALLLLARTWRYGLLDGPGFLVATVDHGLRPESAAEAAAVGELCYRLGIPHVILPWRGPKPRNGVQEAARDERFALLRAFARENRVSALALAHTLDDQAETVLFRLCRGSGIGGLAAMRPMTRRNGLTVLRPFLDVPKARLVATLEASETPFVRDPSNADPKFARPRLRALAPVLENEGLDAERLALLARRAARADAALEVAVDAAQARVGLGRWGEGAEIRLDCAPFFALPEEIGLRLLVRALTAKASEGAVELGKAERLHGAIVCAHGEGARLRRTLAGALVTLKQGYIGIATAPPRQVGVEGLAVNSEVLRALVLGKEGGDP